jgi:hypothetical protein
MPVRKRNVKKRAALDAVKRYGFMANGIAASCFSWMMKSYRHSGMLTATKSGACGGLGWIGRSLVKLYPTVIF